VSPASARIHGITSEMLAGQPPIAQVLPRFARFAEGAVLVGHNVAFDMQFLERAGDETGIRLGQPLLDTLLLSAAAHPEESEHTLESLAARFGLEVVGRHTALGDALLTAEIFLCLAGSLQAQGVVTLGQARAAALRTHHARVSASLYER
jgi:DNA polymerase III subunit epsilon